MRVNALVRSSMIPLGMRGRSYDGLFHTTDWLPTFFGMLNLTDMLEREMEGLIDGVNQWDALMGTTTDSPRKVRHCLAVVLFGCCAVWLFGHQRVDMPMTHRTLLYQRWYKK